MLHLFICIFLYPLVDGCGDVQTPTKMLFSPVRSKTSINRIIGGSFAQLGAWPWQAFIRYTDYTDGKSYICGGALISRRHILTAAHCTLTLDPNRTLIRLGVVDVNSDEGQIAKVKSKIAHWKYSGSMVNNPAQLYDIAILTLTEDVKLTATVGPVCLPNANFTLREYAYVTGFGAFNKGKTIGNKASTALQETLIPIVQQDVCLDKYVNDIKDYTDDKIEIQDSQLCAGTVGHGSAQGDSGGPLVQRSADGRWYQIGVVSFGLNFGKAYYDQAFAPGVFSRVSEYCNFIESATSNEARCSEGTIASINWIFLASARGHSEQQRISDGKGHAARESADRRDAETFGN